MPARDDEQIAKLLQGELGEETGASPATLKVARAIQQTPGLVATSSAATLGRSIGLSDATVIRAVRTLGFGGMAELRQALVAALEGSSLTARMEGTFNEVGEDTGHAIDVTLETHREALAKLQSPEVRALLLRALGLLAARERIVVFGIGPSSLLARYAAMLFGRIGRAAKSLDATGIGLADLLLDLRAEDALLVLAYGRPYPEVMATMAEARRIGVPVILVTDTLEAAFAKGADVVLPAQRGRAGRIALHGATLVLLEALVLGLASMDRPRALRSLERLNGLRGAILGSSKFDL